MSDIVPSVPKAEGGGNGALIVSRATMSALSPAVLLALGAGGAWSLFDLLRRFLAGRMSAWALVVWVTVPALPLLLVWGWTARDWRLEPGYLLPGLASVALNVAANFAYFRAFQLSPISVTLPMLALTPVFSTLFGALALAEPLAPRAAVGITLVVAGAYLLATADARSSGSGRRLESGSLVMALVALFWSATLLLDKLALLHASAPVHALVLNGGVALGGLGALALGGRTSDLGAVRSNLGLLVVAVVLGVVALGSQLLAIQAIPIGFVETLKRGLGGALAVVWGRTFFAEPVTRSKLVAIALLTAGVALLLL